jgi:hypothetical protein
MKKSIFFILIIINFALAKAQTINDKIKAGSKVQWELNQGFTKFNGTTNNEFHDWAEGVLQTRDGGYLVGGQNLIDGTSGLSSEINVIKFNSNGNKAWEVRIATGLNSNECVGSIIETNDNYVFISGGSHGLIL